VVLPRFGISQKLLKKVLNSDNLRRFPRQIGAAEIIGGGSDIDLSACRIAWQTTAFGSGADNRQ
jgi:hypothetical protein